MNKVLVEMWKQKILILFVLPAVAFALVFQYRPMIGVIMAFQDYDILKGLYGSRFVGLENFRQFIVSPDFYRALKNTLGLNILGLLFAFPLPIIFAVTINELQKERFKRVVQSITYLPHFISWVVVAGLFYKMLDQDSGIVNIILEKLGIEAIGFFREPGYFWAIYIIAVIWRDMGWNSILYLSAITGINPELYEAANIDGANRLQRIRHITIPGIAPTIVMLLILYMSNFFNSAGSMEIVLALRNPMVSEASDVIDVYAMISGVQQGYYSYAAAIGLAQSVISMMLLYITNKAMKKISDHSLF